MSEYILTHTGEELDKAIGKVLDGYILPSGTLSITSNGEKNVKNYEKASVNVPIPDGYIKPSGTLSITSNGTRNVSAYASANVNVPLKQGQTTVTGAGTNRLTIAGLAFRPLGYFLFPQGGATWSTGQTVFSGYANDARHATSMSGSLATTEAWHDFNVSGSGTNWTMTIGGNSLSVFRSGRVYEVHYWGV